MSLNFLRDFTAPGMAFRGKPFWAWNGKLEEGELRKQIRLMHRMGLGGFFMHSRVGLETPYLSKEWYACIDACIDEAAKLGMEAWLYDEDRWPSGAAGGLATKNPKYRMRSLFMQVLHEPRKLKWHEDTIAAFTAVIDNGRAREVRMIPYGTVPAALPADQVILSFTVQLQGTSSWYNDYTYLDTLSHDAVRKFIEVTHEAYRKRHGKHFGRTVPGMFTDEPNHGQKFGADNNTGEARGLPWTGKLLKTFTARYGYDLRPRLVELFYDVDDQAVSQARYHYHDCVTHLFVDAFSRQIGEWCEDNDLQFIGHVLEEDSLVRQTNVVGNCMRFYEYMQAPGMDLLTEHWRSFNTAKQVTSVARQFGRTWRLTETYGCTGWDFSFAGHKALGDWQLALGINLRCQHLAWYTMLGEAKRDYPAAIFYQSPWWEYYPKVEDYYARITAVMTRGSEVRDLLVIHPIESAWLMCKLGWGDNPQTYALDGMFNTISESLLAGHIDFDFGDEELMARHATVRKKGGKAELVIGKASYRAVLVPPMTTIRATTLVLLKKFAKAGGKVIFSGDSPQYVDALPSGVAADFARQCRHGVPVQAPDLIAAVEGSCRRISIADEDNREICPALYLLREDRKAYYLFVCNTGEEFSASGYNREPMVRDRTLAFPQVIIRGLGDAAGAPLQLDPETGATNLADATHTSSGWEIRTSLPALGSRLFVIPKAVYDTTSLTRVAALETARQEILGNGTWPIQLSESNVLLLDRPRYRIGDDAWQQAEEVLRVDKAVRAALGVQPRGGAMVQPWARKPVKNAPSVALELAYDFTVDALPSGDLYLALEVPEQYHITLNGAPVSLDAESGWWVDRSMRRLPLNPALLRPGRNELVLACEYQEAHPGLEIIYLLGHFGAEVRDLEVAMTSAPTTLTPGDWCAQGLPFFSGSVSYRCEYQPQLTPGERLFVQVPDYRGACVRVLVDGVPAGIIAWEPNEVEITSLMSDKPVSVQLEVIGHRRNSHGPHHHAEKWPGWVGPAEFQTEGADWCDGYNLVPCGLLAPPRMIVRR